MTKTTPEQNKVRFVPQADKVRSGHRVGSASCPLYPRKRTWFSAKLCGAFINVKRGPPFERVSTSVGLCFRETGFCWAETAVSKKPVTLNRSQQRQSPRAKTHQFGAIRTTSGNLCLYGTAWWSWEDSNFEPHTVGLPARWRFKGYAKKQPAGLYHTANRQMSANGTATRPR